MGAHKIRIEPDWNVKTIFMLIGLFWESIRIEPDWNVKFIFNKSFSNKSRLE